LIDSKRGALNGYPVAYAAPTYRLMGAMWDDLKHTLKPVIRSSNASNHRIELVNGGSIDLWTLQDEDAGRSKKYSLIVVDECAHVKNFEPIWHKSLRPTLSDLVGSAWFLSSPNGFNFFKLGLYDKGDINHKSYDDKWASFRFHTIHNPYIDKAEIADAKKELPELSFAQEYEGAFTSVEGALVRPSYIKEGSPPTDEHGRAIGKTVTGIDLAISTSTSADYTALVTITLTPTGDIYVREVTRFRGTFNEILKEIERTAIKWGSVVIGIEKVQFQASVVQELLRTTQLNAIGIVPKGDKVERFQPVVARYENGLIYHDKKLIPEFEKELLIFPMGVNSPDMVDAFSMAFKALSYSAVPLLTLQVKGL
jgi:predicted phage terminase large subunit-like protein